MPTPDRHSVNQITDPLLQRTPIPGPSPAPALPSRQGEMAGSYRLRHPLGDDPSPTVYLADPTSRPSSKPVVVQFIPPTLAERLRLLNRPRLEHRHIVRLLDSGDNFLVTEYIDHARPLTTFAQSLPLPAKGQLLLAACDALHHSHLHGVIHANLKASNILVNDSGTVKVTGFGLARAAEQATTLTDIHALGLILQQLLPAPAPAEWSAIAARATAPRIEDRYPSVSALAADIRAACDGKPVQAYTGGLFYRLRKWTARNPWPSTAIAAIVLLAAAGITFAVRQQSKAAAHRALLHEMARRVILEDLPKLQNVPNSTAVRASLMKETEAALTLLANEGETDPLRQIEIAAAFHQTGRLKAGSTLGSLSNSSAALADLERSVHFYRLALASMPHDVGIHEKVYRVSIEIAYRRAESGFVDQALQTALAVESEILALPSNLRHHSRIRRELSTVYHALGNIANDQGRLTQEDTYRRQALAVYTAELANPPAGWLNDPIFRDHIANLHAAAACAALNRVGYNPDGEAQARRALDLLAPCSSHRGCRFRAAETQIVLGELLFAAGRLPEAQSAIRQAIAGLEELRTLDQASAVTTSIAINGYTALLHTQIATADLTGARATFSTINTLYSSVRNADPNDRLIDQSDARMLLLEAALLRASNALPDAANIYNRALKLARESQFAATPALQEFAIFSLHALAEIATRQNRTAEAQTYLQQAAPLARAFHAKSPERGAAIWANHVALNPAANPTPVPFPSAYPVSHSSMWIAPSRK